MMGPRSQSERFACSFCGKFVDQVARLIAGPNVYICDECIDLCNDLIEREVERGLPAGTRPTETTAVAVVRRCVLCHLPMPADELVAVPDRGFVCSVCAEAVRVAVASVLKEN